MKYVIAKLRKDQLPDMITALKLHHATLGDGITNPEGFFQRRINSDDSFYATGWIQGYDKPAAYMAIDPIMGDKAFISFLRNSKAKIRKNDYLELGRIFMRCVINAYGLNILYMTIHKDFPPAARLAKLIGFKDTNKEGYVMSDGLKKELYIYQITREEII